MKFGSPPNRGGSDYDWPTVIRDLKRHPGVWALLDEAVKVSIANAIRNGSIHALDGVIVRTRNNHVDANGVRRCDVYLQWPEGK